MSRRRRTAPWIAGVVAVVLLVLVAVLATRPAATTRVADSPLLGRPAPRVAGRLLDGGSISLASLRGKYVVLNFFASWCVPCQREHDDLMRFHARHAAAGDAEVLAVLFDDDPADARRYFGRRGGSWPVMQDPTGVVALDFGVRGPPESFLIDPNGFVLTRIVGEVDDTRLEALLRKARQAARA